MYKFKMDNNYYITAEVLKDDFIEVALYENESKRHSYTFKIKDDKNGRKFFTCFNRDFYI